MDQSPGLYPHHWLPLTQGSNLERDFIIRGIDPNLATHGQFMDLEKHKLIHGKDTTGWEGGDVFVYQWKTFFATLPSSTPTQVFAFEKQLKTLCAGDITNADQIIWPFPK